MSIRDHVGPEIISSAQKFTSWIEDGTIKKRVMPNTSCDFDEEKVLKNAEALSTSGIFDKLITGIYGQD